jgi:hypothetical protein
MKILTEDFNAEVARENIFKPTVENESLQQDSNDNGIRIVNFATTKIYLLTAECSHTETFTNTTVPLLTGRLTT